eukprot:CAMPEP_0174717048 /NCGR_PEP_ID=MMETSP1094-20130205/25723_1 /TAXON_ID=156173 /ORGANISM="Chrysochromulina brevifilum, Strain UTEX LB 985" /LENGTH=60 /DNA_ID=CAMNT_0015916933 /DNA_START=78 /DNA_END=260 /DNA_ORIENTATION=-
MADMHLHMQRMPTLMMLTHSSKADEGRRGAGGDERYCQGGGVRGHTCVGGYSLGAWVATP